MKIYQEYHNCWYKMIVAKRNLDNAQSMIDGILSELSKTVSQLKDVKTNNSNLSDKMSSLISAKIDGEEIMRYQNTLYEHRKDMVNQKLEDLKNSKDLSDIIYYLKFVSKFKTREVARAINYSREYTYELISKIREQLKQIEKTIEEENKKKNN